MARRSILSMLVVLAAVAAVSGPASAATAPVAPVCAKIISTATLNALTGGNFVAANDNPHAPPSACAWNGTATGLTDVAPTDANHHNLTLIFYVGAAQIARQWNVYTHPNAMFGAPIFPSGIGTKAVEANDYIAVVKGKTFFQMWAGSMGAHALEYPQLEAVAKYIAGRVK
jgi:hypothetical protein